MWLEWLDRFSGTGLLVAVSSKATGSALGTILAPNDLERVCGVRIFKLQTKPSPVLLPILPVCFEQSNHVQTTEALVSRTFPAVVASTLPSPNRNAFIFTPPTPSPNFYPNPTRRR